jgi:hypothetical protein
MTERGDDERELVASRLAWLRQQRQWLKDYVDDLEAEISENWYFLGKIDGFKG